MLICGIKTIVDQISSNGCSCRSDRDPTQYFSVRDDSLSILMGGHLPQILIFFVNELIHLFTWTIFIHIPFIFPKDSKKSKFYTFWLPPPTRHVQKFRCPLIAQYSIHCTMEIKLQFQFILAYYEVSGIFLPLVSNDFKPGYH